MQALYFPFTDISAQTVQQLKRVGIDELIVYRPSRQPSDTLPSDSGIQYRCPISDGDSQLQKLYGQYQDWLSIHGGRSGEAAAFFQAAQPTPPFFTDNHTFKITSDIRKQMNRESFDDASTEASTDPLELAARLFLFVAQTFDRQQIELEQALSDVTLDRRQFLETLGSIPGDDRFPTHASEDPGQLMTAQRLRAWGRLLRADRHPPRLLVTDSAAVGAYLQEFVAEGSLQPLQTNMADASIPEDSTEFNFIRSIFSLPIVHDALEKPPFYLAEHDLICNLFKLDFNAKADVVDLSETGAQWIIGDFSQLPNLPEKIISKA